MIVVYMDPLGNLSIQGSERQPLAFLGRMDTSLK